MSSPTWYFDGDLRRIYEVPPDSSYVINGGGYRVYTPNNVLTAPSILTINVQKDLWSRWVDWYSSALWSLEAFSRSGGSLRPTGEYAPADFQLMTSSGWKIVLANYSHESVFYGNLFAVGTDSLFDNSLLTVNGVVPRLQGSANLLTYTSTIGGVGTVEQVRDAVWSQPVNTLTDRSTIGGFISKSLLTVSKFLGLK